VDRIVSPEAYPNFLDICMEEALIGISLKRLFSILFQTICAA